MSAWISCTDRLPEMVSDDGFDRLSDWFLVRQAAGAVYVARLHRMLDPGDQDDATPVWFARGQESRDLREVVAWAEIPA